MYYLPLLCCVQLCHAAQTVISSRFSCFSAFSFPSFSLRALKLFSVNHSEGESLLSFSLRAPDIYFQPLCLRSIFIRLGHLLPISSFFSALQIVTTIFPQINRRSCAQSFPGMYKMRNIQQQQSKQMSSSKNTLP